MKKLLAIPFFLVFLFGSIDVKSQLYAGGSYVYAQLSESGLDQVNGFSFDLQADFNLGFDKIIFSPTFRLAILDSDIYNLNYPFYAKNFSFSPITAYNFIQLKWLTISIYGGPFISKLEARRAPSILFPAAFISDTRYGAEFGIGFKLNIYDVASVKINPLNLLIGNEYYRQGHINFMLNF